MVSERIPERSLHLPAMNELKEWYSSNGLSFVITIFLALALLNSFTLFIGAERVYDVLIAQSYTAFLSFVIYDSPGTIAGLLGVIAIFSVLSLFTYLLLGRRSRSRAWTFILTSMVAGVGSQAIWNSCCNVGGAFPAGSSAVDFAALACLVVYSLSDSVRFLRMNVDRNSRLWVDSKLTAFYFILVGIMLIFFALIIQPIYLPTIRYNWQVHEFAFVSAVVVSLLIEILH